MEKEEYKTIYAILPKYIYTTKRLTCEEKLIAERITALCRKNGRCWVSNKNLADMYGIREDTVSKHIKKLREIGFIKCEYNKNTNNKSNRLIYLTDDVWNKEPSINRLDNQSKIGYISRHNSNYNNKNNINIIPDWLIDSKTNKSNDLEKLNELNELLKEFE